MAPTVVFATNRGRCTVRGTEDIVSPHGIPADLLDRYVILYCVVNLLVLIFLKKRCLIVRTETYTREQVGKVVQLRATVENLQLGPGVLDKLAEEGEKSSLR